MPLCLFPSTTLYPSETLYPYCMPLIASELDLIVDGSNVDLLVDRSAIDITLE